MSSVLHPLGSKLRVVPVVKINVRSETVGSPQRVRTKESTRVKRLICEFPISFVILEINLLAS